jgi:hypothetical protein
MRLLRYRISSNSNHMLKGQIGWMAVNHKRYEWIIEMRD